MTVTIGKYHMLFNPLGDHSVRSISEKGIQQLESELDALANMLTGTFDWVLTGGLAIPCTTGIFYRKHEDIDIGVHENDISALVTTLRNQGYELFSRPVMAKVAPKKRVDMYKQVTVEEAKTKECPRVRIIKTENDRPVPKKSILDYLDLYIHHFEGEELISRKGDVRIPISESQGGVYTTISGQEIHVRSWAYIQQLKKKGTGEKSRRDLAMMGNYQNQ